MLVIKKKGVLYLIVSLINVALAAAACKISEHPSTETGFFGILIIPLESAAWVPNEIQATKCRLTKAPTSAPCFRNYQFTFQSNSNSLG